MDNFDLRKYLAEGKLFEEEFISEVSNDQIQKAAAKALGVSPEELEKQEDQNEEVSGLLAITIAGLIPPALELVGNITNKAKQKYGLSDQEKKELAELNKKQIRLLEKDCAIIWGEQYPKFSHAAH